MEEFMDTLFPLEPVGPEGFGYWAGFLSVAEEEAWLALLRSVTVQPFVFQGYEAKRRVASFGYDYNFDTGGLQKGVPIPTSFQPLMDRVAAQLSVPAAAFAELLVTEYPPGSVINWHRDAPPFDVIAGVSLGADCLFRLRPCDASKQRRGSVVSVPVRRRSLYVLRGGARTAWQHGIAPVKATRWSVTLRTLRGK